MALIDISPSVLYVFHHFPESGEQKASKFFMSIFKLFKKKMARKAV